MINVFHKHWTRTRFLMTMLNIRICLEIRHTPFEWWQIHLYFFGFWTRTCNMDPTLSGFDRVVLMLVYIFHIYSRNSNGISILRFAHLMANLQIPNIWRKADHCATLIQSLHHAVFLSYIFSLFDWVIAMKSAFLSSNKFILLQYFHQIHQTMAITLYMIIRDA